MRPSVFAVCVSAALLIPATPALAIGGLLFGSFLLWCAQAWDDEAEALN